MPTIPGGLPILLQVDPSLDVDVLREKFEFEVVSEQEEGYVIVASQDIDLSAFLEMVRGFSVAIHGSARIASIHKLFDDPSQLDRLRRVLSESLHQRWTALRDDDVLVVDVGIACTGVIDIPTRPSRGKRDTDESWAKKMSDWTAARTSAYEAWDDLKIVREQDLLRFTNAYGAEVLNLVDDADFNAKLPDSFTARIKISGQGFKDLVLNFPYIFEVVEPEDIGFPGRPHIQSVAGVTHANPIAPPQGSPAVCVVDSGIQEDHVLIAAAVNRESSQCFLPGVPSTSVFDEVSPGGHGTRVAGAILYGEVIPNAGQPQLSYWLQNARVLDENCKMPESVFPASLLKVIVEQFNSGDKQTKVFNHSINSNGPCRVRHMSAWAAMIDHLSLTHDVLIVQSAGNLYESGSNSLVGIREHLAAGRTYPQYLLEPSCRVANPAQSLQALTVGSIAYGRFEAGGWTSFASSDGEPSAFTRCGPGIWNAIKPEVVEYGGDSARTMNNPPDVGGSIAEACPSLVRSTRFPPGLPFDRDAGGTSFSTPKVARIAAQLQKTIPGASALLIRALILQSAQWPDWAESILTRLRSVNLDQAERDREGVNANRAMSFLGYGVPNVDRAATNSDFRTTFVAADDLICAGECHIYQVPIPPSLRRAGDEFDVRIDVTLSYVAQPRRTRRNARRYLSTWLDWKSSNYGESLTDFRERAMKENSDDYESAGLSPLPWAIHNNPVHGLIRGFKRNAGTAQKDWAIIKSNALPEQFCVAVVGHKGWSRDPEATARYALTVTLEITGQEISIYEDLRVAVEELQTEIESEVEANVIVRVDA